MRKNNNNIYLNNIMNNINKFNHKIEYNSQHQSKEKNYGNNAKKSSSLTRGKQHSKNNSVKSNKSGLATRGLINGAMININFINANNSKSTSKRNPLSLNLKK